MFGMQELPKAGTIKLITVGYGGSLYLPVTVIYAAFFLQRIHIQWVGKGYVFLTYTEDVKHYDRIST